MLSRMPQAQCEKRSRVLWILVRRGEFAVSENWRRKIRRLRRLFLNQHFANGKPIPESGSEDAHISLTVIFLCAISGWNGCPHRPHEVAFRSDSVLAPTDTLFGA